MSHLKIAIPVIAVMGVFYIAFAVIGKRPKWTGKEWLLTLAGNALLGGLYGPRDGSGTECTAVIGLMFCCIFLCSVVPRMIVCQNDAEMWRFGLRVGTITAVGTAVVFILLLFV